MVQVSYQAGLKSASVVVLALEHFVMIAGMF